MALSGHDRSSLPVLISSRSFRGLLNNLVRAQQQGLRNREAQCLRSVQVDDKVELGRLLDWKVGGPCPLEDLVYVARSATGITQIAYPVAHEASRLSKASVGVHRRQAVFQR